MAGRAPFLPEKISRYVHDHSVREPEILRELRAATAAVPMSGMQIGADQGQFMGLLVQAIGARRCLEIGTYTGYSALAVCLRCRTTATSSAATSIGTGPRSLESSGRKRAWSERSTCASGPRWRP